jgi:YbbR domain-containing protein
MRRLFFENIGLKIAAVLLSIVLWIFVTSRGQSEISIDVPLEFKNIPQGLELVNYSAKEISLSVKGQERLIRSIKPSDIQAYIDLGKTKKGESVYYITRDDIKLPRAIDVINISPSSVKVITEETATKTVRVRPVVVGEPERGYFVKSVEVAPQTLVIEGIRSEVEKINIIRTEPLDITGLNESVTQDVKLDLISLNIRSKTADVKVKVVIGAKGR